MKHLVTILSVLAAMCAAGHPLARETPSCPDDPEYHVLDFWHGEWRVEGPDGEYYGSNRIEPVQGGCAVMEQWTGASGVTGTSLFYRMDGEWRQVWVTPRARVPGGVKEKREVERLDGGGIRFQGEITKESGSRYLDRTTLIPLEGGKVSQVIEFSPDGKSWSAVFDAVYLPAGQGRD